MGMPVFRVKELFHTLQGEGMQGGRAAVFCRFAGCNLWSGREEDRSTARCQFCDTNFNGVNGVDGGVFEGEKALVGAIETAYPALARAQCALAGIHPYVVFTGGEPALQLTQGLIEELHQRGFDVGVETNGTLPLPPGLDWIAVSPKAGTVLAVTSGNELKLVWPQLNMSPDDYVGLNFLYHLLQPCDSTLIPNPGPQQPDNTRLCIAYCLAHPRWRLGVQTHKFIGVR